MTHAFYQAAVPDAWEILGIKLRPFSLGHVVLLHRINSPFINGLISAPATFDDLALSILICSDTYEKSLECLSYKHLPRILRRWADQLTGMDRWLVRWGFRKATIVDFVQTAIDFSSYIREHSKIPDYDFNPSDFGEMHCPEVQMVKVTLMREMGLSEAEIMDRGWGLCLWDYVTLRALDGKVKMIDSELKQAALNTANDLLADIKSGKISIPGVS
jgi:hypothetical protein